LKYLRQIETRVSINIFVSWKLLLMLNSLCMSKKPDLYPNIDSRPRIHKSVVGATISWHSTRSGSGVRGEGDDVAKCGVHGGEGMTSRGAGAAGQERGKFITRSVMRFQARAPQRFSPSTTHTESRSAIHVTISSHGCGARARNRITALGMRSAEKG